MAERRTVLPNASVDALSIGISSSTNRDPPSDAEAKRTIFIGVLRNSAKLGGCLPIELKFGGERPDPITVSDVYLPLVRAPGPSRQPIRREARARCGHQDRQRIAE